MLRVVQVVLPADKAEPLRALLEEQEMVANWLQDARDDLIIAHLLVRTNLAEPLIDLLQQRFGSAECFRALLLRVHATVPELVEEKPDPEPAAEEPVAKEEKPPQRVARAEMRNELEAGIDIGPVFLATVVLSSVIAAVGLLTDNVAVIIGAMVVAPLLTPNMAMAFAVTIGDMTLLRKAGRTSRRGDERERWRRLVVERRHERGRYGRGRLLPRGDGPGRFLPGGSGYGRGHRLCARSQRRRLLGLREDAVLSAGGGLLSGHRVPAVPHLHRHHAHPAGLSGHGMHVRRSRDRRLAAMCDRQLQQRLRAVSS